MAVGFSGKDKGGLMRQGLGGGGETGSRNV